MKIFIALRPVKDEGIELRSELNEAKRTSIEEAVPRADHPHQTFIPILEKIFQVEGRH
jgi:hypothetical protein